jgi:F420-dependent oxidoreductase-like protein
MIDPTSANTAGTAPGGRGARIGLTIPWTAPRVMLDLITQAEAAGVQQFWAPQNPMSTDLLTAFAAAFQRTQTIRLGTSIVPIYPRHPLALAQQAATAAALGAGRLRLGVGTSHAPTTEGVYGVTMDHPLDYLREYVAVLRAALWEGTVNHTGRFLTAQATFPDPPRIPILMAALKEQAFRAAGELSDGAISWHAPLRYLQEVALPALQAGARQANRPVPPLVAHVPVVLSTDRETVREVARQALSFYTGLPFYVKMWEGAGYPVAAPGVVSDKLIDELVVWGDEAMVQGRLQELLDSGCDELLVNGLEGADPPAERTRLISFLGGWR